MAESVVECGVNFLSLQRAMGLVPPEFIPAYEWFLSMEGSLIPRLPRGDDAPSLSVPIKLASQRGMRSPNYAELPSKGAGRKKYIRQRVLGWRSLDCVLQRKRCLRGCRHDRAS